MIEFSQRGAKRSLFGKAGLDAVSRKPIENSELFLTESLISQTSSRACSMVKAAELRDYIRRLPRSQVWRRDHHGRTLIDWKCAEPVAEGRGLALAQGRKRHVDVATGTVDFESSRRVGRIAGQISGGFAVPDDKQRIWTARRIVHSVQKSMMR